MDFRFTREDAAWRQEVRSWLRENVPQDVGSEYYDIGDPESVKRIKAFHQRLAAKDWLVRAWPKEYGGAGATIVEQMIFNEEYGYHRAPYLGPGVHFIGPSIMLHGNEEQKQQYLPEIATATGYWCQGFSEPNVGSDLASLQTRAVMDGDDFVVNGTKIWTSYGHMADHCFLAVRTDETAYKHKGISVLIVDMKTPGVTLTPIINMAGKHHFNQTFFDDVRIPKKNLLGPLNQGWFVMMTALGFERSMVHTSATARRTFEEIVEYTKTTRGPDGQDLSKDRVIASKLAHIAIEIEVARLLAYNTASIQQHGKVPDREASLSKIKSTELLQNVANLGMEILGPFAPLTDASKWHRLWGHMQALYLQSVSTKLGSGTSEIQRNIIATRGLGMPR